MNKKIPDEDYKELLSIKKIYTILDKLEQRIAKLEKVLASHAKCIGELRVQTYMETKGENDSE